MAVPSPLKSWVQPDLAGDFSIHNLPFGIFHTSGKDNQGRVGVRIGNYVIDMDLLSDELQKLHPGQFPGFIAAAPSFKHQTLNDFAELGRPTHRRVREELQKLLVADTEFPNALKDHSSMARMLVPADEASMLLPMRIGDYTDFYAGYHHAHLLGVLFRGPQTALQPNYLQLPVGYHGRASSVVPSGARILRPTGQIIEDPAAPVKKPIMAASRRLDVELELGCFISSPNSMGQPVSLEEAEDHIFGYVLLNDWSARDIQGWEYVPLGPFNGKNFGSTISPWVVPADALEPFKAKGIENQTEILPYLKHKGEENMLDIKLEVALSVDGAKHETISTTTAKNLVWSFPQMIAHHTIGGCPMNAGDLLGTGTISGTQDNERGSLIEMTESGKKEIKLTGGKTRKFLEDGDSVVLRGWCERDGIRVGFGDCEGTVYPTGGPGTGA